MDIETNHKDLNRLRMEYSIPDDIELRVPGKGDILSRPLRGFVTLYLECFKLGVRLPLQHRFAKILGRLHLSPGQLNPNRWRVLTGLFVICWRRRMCALFKINKTFVSTQK